MNNDIKKLKKLYWKETNIEASTVQEFVFAQNDKYFDIFTQCPVFNVLRMLNIDYHFNQYGTFYINNEKVKKINDDKPYIALSKFSYEYVICYESDRCETIRYPLIQNNFYSSMNSKVYLYRNSVLLCMNDFEYVDLYSFFYCKKENIIIDLRNNSGGKLSSMKTFLTQIIDGKLFYLCNKNIKYSITSFNNHIPLYNKNFILLVNNKTASAAEFFTIVLKEKMNTIIIGQRTYGKWVAHTILDYNEYYIKIPCYKFESYGGKLFTLGEGIIPDIECKDLKEIKYYLDKLNIVSIEENITL